jgi:glycosyltransferase involved in cell wall biosynthesis
LHRISVVVTNYNYGHLVGRCIRSLLDQTLLSSDYEIIVVDDCSTDDSISILRNFGDQISLIQLQSNMGLAFASNSGIERCISRYVVRVDADDYVHPKFLETILLGFELVGGSCEAVSCDYLRVDDRGQIIEIGSQEEEPIACAIAFKIDAFEALGFYDSKLRINEEVDLMQKFKRAGMRIFNINLPLYRYVQHSESLTKRVPK